MKKSRSRKYNKRGGDASISMPSTSNTGSSGGIMGWMSNAWNSTKKNSQGLFSKLSESTSNMMNKAKSSLDTSKPSPVSSYSPSPSPSPSPTTSTTSYTPSTSIQGGRKKRGGNSIAYDAAPVHHSNVAKPTYWIGGKSRRKRSKSKSTRRARKHRK
jgi:hypothetical protein